MHIAASNPIAINKDDIEQNIVDKELEIIKAEIINSGKPEDMIEKISKGKITKFLNILYSNIFIILLIVNYNCKVKH